MIDPSNLTDTELDRAISQLESESAMPGPSPIHELNQYRDEAEERGLYL